ncbi:methyltransferase domain-containing protein [Nonomuraea sp. RK-328]|nr:methyltransferase domain-containing protein [Nonomuraea sp. RK-328]
MFNSAVAASAISAAWELGALDELHRYEALDIHEFAMRHTLDVTSTVGMFRALATVEIVERDGNKVTPAANFADAYRARSFFHWLTRGSAELFRQMPEIMPTQNRAGDFYRRDAAAIAFACREISVLCYDPWFSKALEALDFEVHVVADLGCGSGERIMQVLRHHPEAHAVGIDIASAALNTARTDARRAGLEDRITLINADVVALEPRPEFAEVELLTCFMMGHDFWPRQRCVDTLQRLARVFPNTQRFILGDATRAAGGLDNELPLFRLGFELAHDLMGTFIPSLEDWESVFDEGGWSVRQKHAIDMTVGEVIFELERA